MLPTGSCRTVHKPQRTKVVVTGMGAVCATGLGAERLWMAARSGQSAIGEAQLARAGSNPIKTAAQLRDFPLEDFIEPKLLPYCDRFSQFAIVAADEALRQAGLGHDGPL